ncbi:unnamed protein product [Durusdinium trenchii]|uniref:Uncharacterized protein n=2 Tax=Durusdinium trenchii TaxID=1381693 RepID=A0ABP0SLX4_9DINO
MTRNRPHHRAWLGITGPKRRFRAAPRQLFESVGRNVVPLAHAVTRPASLIFLLFLTCSLLATFHAYFVFPLHQETSLDTVLDRLIDMFRLEMLSDFDLDELLLDRLRDAAPASLSQTRPDPKDDARGRQYQGIRVGFVLISLSLSVVAMNTYIGLLGELYTEAVQKKNQIYNNYLATVLWPHLSMPLGPSITSSPAYVVRQARSVLTDAGESLRR